MSRRVLLIGATGGFGQRMARMLAAWPELELILAARSAGPLKTLAAVLADEGAHARISVVALDRAQPAGLAASRPWAVIDAAGPFQGGDLGLARAAIAAGAHYIDLADARDFVRRFPDLDAEARAAGVLAVAGASSTPALSNAALNRITAGWRRIDRVAVAISPGAVAPSGLSVIQAILSYVGRPVRVWRDAGWREAPGWSGVRRLTFPGLGQRWVSLCETPDLDILPRRAAQDAEFLAGLELAPLHLGLWLLSWPVRVGLVKSLVPLARPLRGLAGLFAPLGSDRGGMVVIADGEGPDGERLAGRWALWAETNAGPSVPVAAAAAVLRGLLAGEITERGAKACVGVVGLDAILAELAGLPIHTRADEVAPGAGTLLRRLLGRGEALLDVSVIAVHGREASATFGGAGRARGSMAPLARLVRAVLGVPDPGDYPNLQVTIAPDGKGETWTRDFGARGFSSRLVSLDEPGQFEERFGPLRFSFRADPTRGGFRWRFVRWSLAGLPLPIVLAPNIRALSFATDGVYRFRAITAHPWLGLIFAYSGRLKAAAVTGKVQTAILTPVTAPGFPTETGARKTRGQSCSTTAGHWAPRTEVGWASLAYSWARRESRRSCWRR